MRVLRRLADSSKAGSLASRLRRRRFAFFESLLADLPRPVRVLDVGGTPNFWLRMGYDPTRLEVTILNYSERPAATAAGFEFVRGDARRMPQFADNQFDVVFSNSVIEHVGGFDDQKKMADEVRRVGRRFFVQTPNYWFPIEPHFLFPGFQFLPLAAKVWLLRRFKLGWPGQIPDAEAARARAEGVQLLSRRAFRRLFPGARLHSERILGLTKSFVAYDGFAS